MDDSSALLLNSDCRDQSDPTSCPNTWKYLDSSDGYAWKADSYLKVACGTKNVPNLSLHRFLIQLLETCDSIFHYSQNSIRRMLRCCCCFYVS